MLFSLGLEKKLRKIYSNYANDLTWHDNRECQEIFQAVMKGRKSWGLGHKCKVGKDHACYGLIPLQLILNTEVT